MWRSANVVVARIIGVRWFLFLLHTCKRRKATGKTCFTFFQGRFLCAKKPSFYPQKKTIFLSGNTFLIAAKERTPHPCPPLPLLLHLRPTRTTSTRLLTWYERKIIFFPQFKTKNIRNLNKVIHKNRHIFWTPSPLKLGGYLISNIVQILDLPIG